MGSNPSQEDCFFFFCIFILFHGNAPVICKRDPHAQKIAETMTSLPFTALLKGFEDNRKSIATLFFCPQSPNAPDIAQGRYCPRKSLPKHFPHIVCLIKNHCHAIPAKVVEVGTSYWCINAHSCFRYFPKIGSPSPNF